MPVGFEAAKGAAENVLGVKLPIFMRMVLPGLLVTAVLYPFVAWILSFLPSDPEHLWEPIAAYAVLVFLLGALISTGNSEIYKIYEGRVLWPGRLLEWACHKQQARVVRLLKAAKAAPTETRYNELWYRLRDYPINLKTGNPLATHPTMIGNILAGYEQYPDTRYGMDSVFFWSRIWLQLDKNQREEIDSQWCVADGFLTLSAISFAGGVIWTVQALVAIFKIGVPVATFGTGVHALHVLPFGNLGWAFVGVLGWLVLGYFWYRFSIPFHRQNGDLFKSIFDIYRDKVWSLTSFKPHEKENWEAAWAYLQYLALQCPKCHDWTPAVHDQCDKCHSGLLKLKKHLRDSGKFSPGK